MEEVLLRFGHVGDQIFEELESQTLTKCRFVGKPWKLFLDQGKVQAFRIIKTYTNINEKYIRKGIKKINVETAKDLATTVRDIYQDFPWRGGNVNPSLYGDTPLHIAASCGHFKICQLIIDNLHDKNPKNNSKITPLHYAAKNGHMEICRLIIEDVDAKNPKDLLENTPLHHAAENGHLEICQLIIYDVDDKNPKNKVEDFEDKLRRGDPRHRFTRYDYK